MSLDPAIVSRAQAGDSAAREAVCLHMRPLIRRHVRKFLVPNRNNDLLSELEGEGMAAVLESLLSDSFWSYESFEIHSLRYVRRAIKRYCRTEKRYHSGKESDLSDLELLPSKTPSLPLEIPLDCLSAPQRIIVQKIFGIDSPEMSAEAIAAEMGLTVRRVKQILADALERLRIMLPRPEED